LPRISTPAAAHFLDAVGTVALDLAVAILAFDARIANPHLRAENPG
jgi:hypothetical protein